MQIVRKNSEIFKLLKERALYSISSSCLGSAPSGAMPDKPEAILKLSEKHGGYLHS